MAEAATNHRVSEAQRRPLESLCLWAWLWFVNSSVSSRSVAPGARPPASTSLLSRDAGGPRRHHVEHERRTRRSFAPGVRSRLRTAHRRSAHRTTCSCCRRPTAAWALTSTERWRRSATSHAFIVPVYEVDGRIRGNAIVSTVRCARHAGFRCRRNVSRAWRRLATITIGGQSLFVVSTHFENRLSWLRGGVFSDTARGRQAEALLRALPDGPGILGGDLNTLLGPAEPAWRLFADAVPGYTEGAARPDVPGAPRPRSPVLRSARRLDRPDGASSKTATGQIIIRCWEWCSASYRRGFRGGASALAGDQCVST